MRAYGPEEGGGRRRRRRTIPESEFYLQSGLPSSRPLCKYLESTFQLQGGIPLRTSLDTHPESESAFPKDRAPSGYANP